MSVPSPRLTGAASARMTLLNQTLDREAIATSPITSAFGATNTSSASVGARRPSSRTGTLPPSEVCSASDGNLDRPLRADRVAGGRVLIDHLPLPTGRLLALDRHLEAGIFERLARLLLVHAPDVGHQHEARL